MREFRDGKIVEAPDVKVSDQKPLTINLLRHRVTGRWFNANLEWVDDITLASVISDEVYGLVLNASPVPDRYELVKFVQLPF